MTLPWLKGVMCFLYKDNKVRLCDYRATDHKIHAGKYSPNGGKIELEQGETSLDATVREMMEETNTVIKNPTYRGRVHFNNEKRTVNGKPMKFNMMVDIWDCYDFDDSNAQAKENGAKLEWISKEQMLQKELHEGDRRVLEWLIQYPIFEGVIVQYGEKLVEEESRILDQNPTPIA